MQIGGLFCPFTNHLAQRRVNHCKQVRPQSEMYRVDIVAIQPQLEYEIAPVYIMWNRHPQMITSDDLPLNEAQ